MARSALKHTLGSSRLERKRAGNNRAKSSQAVSLQEGVDLLESVQLSRRRYTHEHASRKRRVTADACSGASKTSSRPSATVQA